MSEKSRSNTPVYITALALFLAGVGYLIYSGVAGGSVYFLEVSEALALEPGQATQCRVFGTVAPHGIQTKDGRLGVVFNLEDQTDKAKTLQVNYGGAVPDTFEPGVEVIVEGGYDPDSKTFSAASLMTKCPSKYQKENRT